MAIFPQYASIGYANPLIKTVRTKTLISRFETQGEEKRRQKWLYHKWDLSLSYRYISKANAATLYQFYQTHGGQATAFNFFEGHSNDYSTEYVATGDGSTATYNLPFKSGSSIVIQQSGSTVSSGSYTINAGSGASGADQIVFSSSVGSAVYVTANFTGKLKVRGRFMDEDMTFETFYNRLHNTGIEIRGLANA